MTTLHVLPDGTIRGLFTEALDLTTLGPLEVHRAMAIEFDNPAQVWRVFDPYGQSVYDSPWRENCLTWERQYLNGVLENS
jgi:hypothetical protein